MKVFTFGMAHKIRVPLYRRLRDLLEATGKSYSVYVSTALHENTSFDGCSWSASKSCSRSSTARSISWATCPIPPSSTI